MLPVTYTYIYIYRHTQTHRYIVTITSNSSNKLVITEKLSYKEFVYHDVGEFEMVNV